MSNFCTRNNLPAFVGEFGVVEKKEAASRVKWMTAVMNAAASRNMVPVLWDTGHDFSRREPYAPSETLTEVLRQFAARPKN
ncbi:MAG: cellulase family glycosylhydrolase [Polyangiaceae bacterium]